MKQFILFAIVNAGLLEDLRGIQFPGSIFLVKSLYIVLRIEANGVLFLSELECERFFSRKSGLIVVKQTYIFNRFRK